MLLLSFRSEVKKRSYGTSRQLHNVRRAAYVAAADYGPAELASPLEIVYAIVTLSFETLVISFLIPKGVFNKITAYLGLATSILGSYRWWALVSR